MNLKRDTHATMFYQTNKQTIFSILLSCMEQIFGNVAHSGPKETGTKKGNWIPRLAEEETPKDEQQ